MEVLPRHTAHRFALARLASGNVCTESDSERRVLRRLFFLHAHRLERPRAVGDEPLGVLRQGFAANSHNAGLDVGDNLFAQASATICVSG